MDDKEEWETTREIQYIQLEKWAKKHHPSLPKKEITRVKAQLEDFENGPKYFHGCAKGEGILRLKILRLSQKTKQGTSGEISDRDEYSKAILEAAIIIKKEANWEIEPFDLAVALRFRFLLSFEEH